MALIMYLTKAPRYQNVVTDEYETIPREDIALIERYFNWKRARANDRTDCNTLKEWCGVPEDEMPHKYIVNFYRQFYTMKEMYVEYVGNSEMYSLFEQVARVAKANQIFNWFVNNVMHENVNQNYYEVTKEQLEDLYVACNEVKKGFTLLGVNQDGENEYSVDEKIAKEFLPVMGNSEYGALYAKQVIKFAGILSNILAETDFEKETIYFNAIW